MLHMCTSIRRGEAKTAIGTPSSSLGHAISYASSRSSALFGRSAGTRQRRWYFLTDVGIDTRSETPRTGCRALLVYISRPFFNVPGASHMPDHTNVWEARALVKELAQRGWSVDVLDHRSPSLPRRARKRAYELIIGFGSRFEDSMRRWPEARHVYYATGAPLWIANARELARVGELRDSGLQLWPRRYQPNADQMGVMLSDEIWALGDGWSYEQYRGIRGAASVHAIMPSYLSDGSSYPTAGDGSFIWFGSSGAIHKGLDLFLDAAAARPNQRFLVAGNIGAEPEALAVMRPTLSLPNVRVVGHLSHQSARFRAALSQATFVVQPSVSEGCSTGVLTAMAWGCIPVISRECGIPAPMAIPIHSMTYSAVLAAIDVGTHISPTERAHRSRAAREWVVARYGQKQYRESVRAALGSWGWRLGGS